MGILFALFVKKKNGPYYGDFTNLQKNFFLSFKKCETTSLYFFFSHLRIFQENWEKKNTIFIFELQKISILCIKKKSFLAILP